jgi:hypothetical protein
VTLVETLISAAILIVVLFAVLGSLDAASHTAAINRSRTVAASLAEQELERLRSLPAATLASFNEPAKERTIGNTKYLVASNVEWVHDASGTPASCDSDGEQADYIRITSTVTSNVVGKRVKPVQMNSLIAPRVGSFGANQGTLAVQVRNELDAPVPDMPVTIEGLSPRPTRPTRSAAPCSVTSRRARTTSGSASQAGSTWPGTRPWSRPRT